jgi:hypothetical protein
LFPLFAAAVIDTSGKLASTAPAEPVAKFAAGVVDTGGAPWLANMYLPEFLKNLKWP